MLDEILPNELPQQEIIERGSYIFIMGLLLFGMVITVAETIIKYYGLNLKKFKDSLQVEMGLRNNTKVNIRAARVQMVEINTNPVQKLLKLFTIKIALASSENDLEKSRIKIPGLPPEVVEQVQSFFLKKHIEEKLTIIPHKIVLWRKFTKGSIPAMIGLVIGFFFQDQISVELIGGIGGIYLFLLSVYNFFYYKTLQLSLDQEILVKSSGLWVKKQQYLEIYRLQAISVRQPIWYIRRGIVNLTFHSAGGDITFNGVRKEQVKPLVNYLLYKVEGTLRPWM